MNILEKIDMIEDMPLNESGIRDIKKLRKEFDKAEIYFHVDLDGVASAIGMKYYLENSGFKVIDAHKIQYGSTEYAIPKGQKGVMKVLVDFAHGKPLFSIHTDHHDSQAGVGADASTAFKHAPSNAGMISGEISPKDLFPPKDLEIINTVDSAGFAKLGLSPDDIINATFNVNKNIPVAKNHMMMGLVVNKLLLSYKNKPEFLETLVMKSKPSLISMFNIIKKLAVEHGYKTPEQINTDSAAYQGKQSEKVLKDGKLSDVKKLKNGQSVKIGNLLVQYGGGYMGAKNQYDRYTPFKLNPDISYFSIAWAVGLVQLSMNPFKKAEKDLHLGDIVMKKVMPKFKSVLSKEISLADVKRIFEMDITKKKLENRVGFTFDDLMALFEGKLKNLPDTGNYRKMIADITNKPFNKLSKKQKAIIEKVKISVWDIVMSSSGGHKAITNIAGVNFMGKGYASILHDIQYEIAKEMQKY